eukprot:Sro864_g212630.2  (508) ;mRNA; r:22093-23616
MKGEAPRALFGQSIDLYTALPNFILLAVSSPYYDDHRGKVQIFYINKESYASQLRNTVEGESAGDLFGLIMRMNDRGAPTLGIGAPQCSSTPGASGCMYVYQWGRPNATEPLGWSSIHMGAMSGVSALAISSGPSVRIATASMHPFCNETGLIRLYEIGSSDTPTIVGSLRIPNYATVPSMNHVESSYDWLKRGFAVGLNMDGSVIAAGSAYGDYRHGRNASAIGIVRTLIEPAVVEIFSSSPPPSFSPTSCEILFPTASPSQLYLTASPMAPQPPQGPESKTTAPSYPLNSPTSAHPIGYDLSPHQPTHMHPSLGSPNLGPNHPLNSPNSAPTLFDPTDSHLSPSPSSNEQQMNPSLGNPPTKVYSFSPTHPLDSSTSAPSQFDPMDSDYSPSETPQGEPMHPGNVPTGIDTHVRKPTRVTPVHQNVTIREPNRAAPLNPPDEETAIDDTDSPAHGADRNPPVLWLISLSVLLAGGIGYCGRRACCKSSRSDDPADADSGTGIDEV